MCLDEANAWAQHVAVPCVAPAERKAATFRVLALLQRAFETLQRRRDAGTLPAGACRPAEVAWYAARIKSRSRLDNPEALYASSHALLEQTAPFIGHEAYLQAGWVAQCLLCMLRSADMADAKMQLAAIAVTALDLMALPRPRWTPFQQEPPLPSERALYNAMTVVIAQADSMAAEARQLLPAAWARLHASGVPRTLGLERKAMNISGAWDEDDEEEDVAAGAALRPCALEGCGACEVHPAQYKHCAACKQPVYCCKEHQVAQWPVHKAACRAARKAAAAAAEDGAGPSDAS